MSIPAVAVRELIYDADGGIVKTPRPPRRRRFFPSAPGATAEPAAPPTELQPGQTRKETEGVFVVRGTLVEFVPIKIGISGDRYFEVLDGLEAGDRVVTGPYNTVRGMADGDIVKVDQGR